MRLATNEVMQTIDRITIQEVGLEGKILMENAGRAIANSIMRDFTEIKPFHKVVIIAGKGNNG